ncbi:DUF3817 domain-containing protein [bacterium LRH843]|nr:DUF3817 domain-containing protein [bacterium LRH843]
MSTSLKSFRVISYLEGLSFLLLLGIAMPLKYLLDMPLAVTVVGYIHGILFVLYLVVLAYVTIKLRWSIVKGLLGVIASVLPFGPFIFDKKVLKEYT